MSIMGVATMLADIDPAAAYQATYYTPTLWSACRRLLDLAEFGSAQARRTNVATIYICAVWIDKLDN